MRLVQWRRVYGRKHQESIRESCYDRDSKDLHAGICSNPQKDAQCMNRMIDLSDWRSRCMVCARLMHKKNNSKECDKRNNNNNNNNNNNYNYNNNKDITFSSFSFILAHHKLLKKTLSLSIVLWLSDSVSFGEYHRLPLLKHVLRVFWTFGEEHPLVSEYTSYLHIRHCQRNKNS